MRAASPRGAKDEDLLGSTRATSPTRTGRRGGRSPATKSWPATTTRKRRPFQVAARPRRRAIVSPRMAASGDPSTKFDAYARNYVALHKQSVADSGEDPAYFAEYKQRCLERLAEGGGVDGPVLDYGCGIGSLMERLRGRFGVVDGYDPSRESLAVARERVPGATLFDDDGAIPDGHYALAVLACVLHHVPVAEREALLRRLRAKLR